MDWMELFCNVDDFCQDFEPRWRQRLITEGELRRESQLVLSEVLAILVAFHRSGFRKFEAYYLNLFRHHRAELPKLVNDQRFVELTATPIKQDLRLVTGLRKNMREKLLPLWDKLMLRKRSLIETVIDQLKNISQIEHTRHCSPSTSWSTSSPASSPTHTNPRNSPSTPKRFNNDNSWLPP